MDLKSLVTEFQSYRYSDRAKIENAEFCYTLWAARQEPTSHHLQSCSGDHSKKAPSISKEIHAVRQQISQALNASELNHDTPAAHHTSQSELGDRVTTLEIENKRMTIEIKDLKDVVNKLQATVNKLTLADTGAATNGQKAKPKEADDEIDLFGSDEDQEDDEMAKVREQRLKAYEEKKSKKPGPIAKSSVILDVKPWDDETDMAELEKAVRLIQMDGLLWGASKLVPVAYNVRKLQIMCVVEDDKVSIEELQEKIETFEDFVQSVDIAAFNKI